MKASRKTENANGGFESRAFVFFLKEPAAIGEPAHCAGDIYERMKGIEQSDQESFWLFGFDTKLRELFCECVFLGGLNTVFVDVRILFKRLLTAGAAAFLVLHNHQTLCAPSDEDRALVDRLKMISNMLDLRFVDSIIVAEDGFWSFYDNGLM